jgi:hypothetical protein
MLADDDDDDDFDFGDNAMDTMLDIHNNTSNQQQKNV